MKQRFTFIVSTLVVFLFLGPPLANAGVTVSRPENVILSLTGDITEMAVTWRDTAGVAVGQVRYGRTENLSSSAAARRTVANGYNSFEAVMTGLVPGETYYYKVGSVAAWSEIQSFIAPEGDTSSFSFLYLGDVQCSIPEYKDWNQLLVNAYDSYGDAVFGIMGGDMVNYGQNVGEWQVFLREASRVFSKIPMMAVPGNHESNDITTGKPTLMNKLLCLPQNGLAGFKEEFYSFEYGDCHILCLNSNVYLEEQLQAGTMTLADFDRIKTWIASDLSSSSATWKIAVMHHPAYSVVSDKAGVGVLANWVPLFEAAKVDLVLYGHQHIYMRTKPIWEGQIDYEKGITYLMSNSGSKHYPGRRTDYQAILIENIPTYQAITINGDMLCLVTCSADGKVMDSFNLCARVRNFAGDGVVTKVKDISGHWAETSINKLVNAGAISGYPDGTFKPDSSITRAEFATVLVKALNLEARSGKVFNDTTGHWAKDAISTAAAHGIVSGGYDATTFGPDNLITREQMAVMISRVANLSGGEGKTFADNNQIADWAKAEVAAASGKSIISGYPDNIFRPRANATRAEAVTVIVKILN